ncbi:hypothetical protein SAMN05216559_1667 [Halomicrobium zhouii]|uniref:Uncharacterized protein n=1 Tax=Halomicrobium zhouii TaxID=767519 RepID=A0A1I6L0C0_9EURY|nr:hypothetical protein [Halomicrobium zhouii]SFR96630.1 hypothetical protein SAMN05216559_1667 [Halomicrobium zhouii]
MATPERTGSSASRDVATVWLRLLLVAAVALVETLVLGVWLVLVWTSPTLSLATGFAFAVLAGGLVVAFFGTDLAVNGSAASFPGLRAIAVVLFEVAAWALWLLVASRVDGLAGIAAAGAAFALVLVPQHTVADNVLRGESLVATLVDFDALGASLVQAGGATLWLLFTLHEAFVAELLTDAEAAFGEQVPVDLTTIDPGLVGLAALAAALFVEHLVGVSFSRHG